VCYFQWPMKERAGITPEGKKKETSASSENVVHVFSATGEERAGLVTGGKGEGRCCLRRGLWVREIHLSFSFLVRWGKPVFHGERGR